MRCLVEGIRLAEISIHQTQGSTEPEAADPCNSLGFRVSRPQYFKGCRIVKLPGCRYRYRYRYSNIDI